MFCALSIFWIMSIFALMSGIAAQQIISTPACSVPAFNWTTNGLGQDVCRISGLALTACTTANVTIGALLPGNAYTVDSEVGGDVCRCNSVFYSLISACGGCQGGGWETYAQWTANCTKTLPPQGTWPSDVAGFPNGTEFPAWAFQPVSSFGIFNNLTAFQFWQSNKSEIASLPASTSTAASSSSTVASTSATTSQTAAATPASRNSHAGAIAGGVVGGVVGVALLVGLGWYLVLRQRRRVAASAGFSVAHTPTSAIPAFINDGASVAHPRYYDPTDPSTFPDPSVGTTSPGPTINTTHQNGHKTMASWGSETSGDYRGLPEV